MQLICVLFILLDNYEDPTENYSEPTKDYEEHLEVENDKPINAGAKDLSDKAKNSQDISTKIVIRNMGTNEDNTSNQQNLPAVEITITQQDKGSSKVSGITKPLPVPPQNCEYCLKQKAHTEQKRKGYSVL